MSGVGCWLAERAAAAAMAALRTAAERLAETVRAGGAGPEVAVRETADGMVVSASAVGLGAREFGSAAAAPDPVVGAAVALHGQAIAAAVAASVARALGER